MNNEGNSVWKVLSVISFIGSAVFMYLGFDKMTNYSNGDIYPYKMHNAYVGGDAYNYIINGNYATAFFVLAAMCALIGVGLIAVYYLAKLNDKQERLISVGLQTYAHLSPAEENQSRKEN